MDHVDRSYYQSEEGLAWPEDAPLTDAGVLLARDVGDELAALNEEARFMAIATSPYRRCMQTAAEIAKRLDLPVLIDQELGEVRDIYMSKDSLSHRSPKELVHMADELGMKLTNPRYSRGGLKLFGKKPPWPETLDSAKRRFIVRIENYIRQSADTQRNMILVTHADALAGVLMMFEREGVQVQQVDFCGRIIARRTVRYLESGQVAAADEPKATTLQPALVKRLFLTPSQGVYADAWAIECRSVIADSMRVEALARYHEKMYLETCEETAELCRARDSIRSRGDELFDRTIRTLSCSLEEFHRSYRSEGSLCSSSYMSFERRSSRESTPSRGGASGSPEPLAEPLADPLAEQEPGCFQAWRQASVLRSNVVLKQLPLCLRFLCSGKHSAAPVPYNKSD